MIDWNILVVPNTAAVSVAGMQSVSCFAVLMKEEICVLNKTEGRRTWTDGFIRDKHALSDGE